MNLSKILYIEDDKDIQKIAELSLKQVGKFDLQICSSGREALQEVIHYHPDLILLDVMMPEMDGITTFKELRKIPVSEKIPVIFMTAKVQSSETQQYISMGAIGVIAKPFDPMTLKDQILDIRKKQ